MTIKFKDIEADIRKSLSEKIKISPPEENSDGYGILDGFIIIPCLEFSPDSLLLAGPYVLGVGLVSHKTGRMYTYVVTTLLPDLKI